MIDGIDVRPEDLKDPFPVGELSEDKWERGQTILKIFDVLHKSIGKKDYLGFDDNGLFTEERITTRATLIDIAIEIYHIIKKIGGDLNEEIIKKAIKVWFLFNDKNNKLSKLMPEYLLKKIFPENLLKAINIMAKIYKNTEEEKISIAKSLRSWYSEADRLGELPDFSLEEYFGEIFSKEITDELSKTRFEKTEEELKRHELVMNKLEKLIGKRHLVVELLGKNKEVMLEANREFNNTEVSKFLQIPISTFSLFLKKYANGEYVTHQRNTKSTKDIQNLLVTVHDRVLNQLEPIARVAKDVKIEKHRLSMLLRKKYGDNFVKDLGKKRKEAKKK